MEGRAQLARCRRGSAGDDLGHLVAQHHRPELPLRFALERHLRHSTAFSTCRFMRRSVTGLLHFTQAARRPSCVVAAAGPVASGAALERRGLVGVGVGVAHAPIERGQRQLSAAACPPSATATAAAVAAAGAVAAGADADAIVSGGVSPMSMSPPLPSSCPSSCPPSSALIAAAGATIGGASVDIRQAAGGGSPSCPSSCLPHPQPPPSQLLQGLPGAAFARRAAGRGRRGRRGRGNDSPSASVCSSRRSSFSRVRVVVAGAGAGGSGRFLLSLGRRLRLSSRLGCRNSALLLRTLLGRLRRSSSLIGGDRLVDGLLPGDGSRLHEEAAHLEPRQRRCR